MNSGELIKTLPDNLTNLTKKLLHEIAKSTQAIPKKGSILEVIISKTNKTRLQPTIKKICDDYCNRAIKITPPLFVYFASNFNFINKMTSRSGDITRNILNEVILDSSCLEVILENSSGYIRKINEAGDDAEDLKVKVIQMLNENQSDDIINFASQINVTINKNKDNDLVLVE